MIEELAKKFSLPVPEIYQLNSEYNGLWAIDGDNPPTIKYYNLWQYYHLL